MRTLAVIGHGMVGHKLVATLLEGGGRGWEVVVFGEEPHPAYDRVHLSSLFEGAVVEDLDLGRHPDVTVHAGDRVTAIDRRARTLTTDRGRTLTYDAAVLATGSVPFVPPVPGRDLPGCFAYRTLDDVAAIQHAARHARHGVVVGGGLLGLEAAGALRSCGLVTEVVELAPHLMPQQVDPTGGGVLRARLEDLGVTVHVGRTVGTVHAGADGRVEAVDVGPAGGGERRRVETDLVVWSAGIRPRDDLARACGLAVGERGGVVIDEQCRTSDPAVFAIGECALAGDRVHGLVGPGYEMARVVAGVLRDEPASFTSGDLSTKLKLLGVDVASFGDARGEGRGCSTITFTDEPARVHRRLVIDGDGRVRGGVLVGDASGYDVLAQMALGHLPTPEDPATLIGPDGGGGRLDIGTESWPDEAQVCSCEAVSKEAVCGAVRDGIVEAGTASVASVKQVTGAGTGCGGCVPLLDDIVRAELTSAGVAVSDDLCEHFPHTRQELFDMVVVEGIDTFAELLRRHGRGRGCEICKPAVASILASVHDRYILDADQASLQDTNDHFLANMQKDGTYSVVPRVPGGEISPDKLITIGEVARDFGLYTKITGGQRIDLFGARVDQLPAIWARLVDAGMESGHAYGKAMRTVKSCVGTNWCRYGVQDSTGLAVAMELRYRGLRSPHKIKLGVSGCSRECAEAQSKDVGVIATERGWDLYVGGNGGTTPRHAERLLSDVDTDTLVRTVDRYLMYYLRTAKRLQRTAPWQERFPGGLAELRRILVDDSLGICADLDAAMARHVDAYHCEWKATLEDPERLRRFRSFINSDAPDGDIVFVPERDQHRPATAWERVELSAPAGARG
jgi:nitrite reductase (NADH) large subunit